MKGKTHLKIWGVFVVGILSIVSAAAGQTIIYVDSTATGANDGSIWPDAYRLLQDGLAAAAVAPKPVEVRVAQGIYKPDQGGGKTQGDRNASFELLSDVTILGGYAGLDGKDPNTGARVDPNTRDPKIFFTTLSGDLKGDDTGFSNIWDYITDPKRDENSEHVVVAIGAGVIDGCAITAGNSKSLAYDDGGAGIYCMASAVAPIISNCMIGQNKAAKNGGGILVKGKSPQIINCEFNYNYADCGGAIALWQTAALVNGCTIAPNRARLGGGCFTQEGTPTIENCEITYSYAEERGGGCFINNSTLSSTFAVFEVAEE